MPNCFATMKFLRKIYSQCESCSVMSNSLWPHGLYSPWSSPSQNTGVGIPSPADLPNPVIESGSPDCRLILYQLCYRGSQIYSQEANKNDKQVPPLLYKLSNSYLGFPVALVVKNSAVQGTWETQVPTWVRKIPRGGHGHPLQHSHLENPMDRGAWWATAHGVTQNRMWLDQLGSCSS